MAFHLKYVDGDKVRRQQFTSYYECIKTKEKLRNKGIKVKFEASGVDVPRVDYTSTKLGKTDRGSIKNFLQMCDNIGDFKNAKTYGRINKKEL